MKHMLSIAATAFLTCGLVGARASAHDGCNSCDTCGSGKKFSLFNGGFFSKKNCGGCDSCATPVVYSNSCDSCNSCDKGWKLSGFRLFGKKGCDSCGCDSAPAHHDCNTCNSCDSCGKKKWSLPKFRSDDCGCDSGCRKLS